MCPIFFRSTRDIPCFFYKDIYNIRKIKKVYFIYTLMKIIKLFEEFKDIMSSEYNKTDSPDLLTSRDEDIILQYSNRNEWDSEKMSRNSDYKFGFYKKDGDYEYNIQVEKQEDDYYLIFIEFKAWLNPEKDEDRYLLLDGYEELVEFLQRVEIFYNRRRIYDISFI